MNAKIAVSGDPHLLWRVAETVAIVIDSANVSDRVSIVGGKLESGYLVEIYDVDPADIAEAWRLLKHRLNFGCAWFETDGFAGCIVDYFATRRDRFPRQSEITARTPGVAAAIHRSGKGGPLVTARTDRPSGFAVSYPAR